MALYNSTRDVVIAAICVLLGCAAAAGAVDAARRTRNWLLYLCALGAVVFVVGVVGQRVFPTEDARRGDPQNASHQTPRAWEAGVQIPVINISATPVAVGGFLLAVVGLSLVLFFEAIPDRDIPPRPVLPAVEDGDAV
jgi:hypothetical protein